MKQDMMFRLWLMAIALRMPVLAADVACEMRKHCDGVRNVNVQKEENRLV